MALIKGRFIDPTEAINLDLDPVIPSEVTRKSYVDTKSEQEAAAALSAAEDYADAGLALKQDNLGTGTLTQYLRGDLTWQEVITSSPVEQVKYVSKNGNDAEADGSEEKPYLTITAAMTAITDASPTKRYGIRVAPGAYTESTLELKANVFIIGDLKEAVRITATSVSMAADFNGSADSRSGLARVILNGTCNFDWTTVTSAAGKLYFTEVSFNDTINMNGYNSPIAQAQFDSCILFDELTISGINMGVFKNNTCFGNITVNQHPTSNMPSIFVATGGYCAETLRFNTTVNDFTRRSAGFLRAFSSENLIIDGPSSYADVDLVSQGKSSLQKINGGNLVALTSRINHALETELLTPSVSNTHNLGDWNKQWLFNFANVHGSSGTDLYLLSAMENYDPTGDTSGKGVFILADGYGLQENVDGGNIELETATVSGTGIRGKVQVKARELDMTSVKITNLADGVDPQDAVTKSQLEAAVQAADQAPYKENKTITATDISNGYVDLIREAMPKSMIVSISGTVQYEDEDYTLSNVNGVTRITFTGDLAPGVEDSGIVEGDKLYFQYWAPLEN